MTGFGRGSVAENNYSIAVELKTVNNRFLDVNTTGVTQFVGPASPADIDVIALGYS